VLQHTTKHACVCRNQALNIVNVVNNYKQQGTDTLRSKHLDMTSTPEPQLHALDYSAQHDVQQVLQQVAQSFTTKDLVVAHHLYGPFIQHIIMSPEQ
jgi:hypothetical protein